MENGPLEQSPSPSFARKVGRAVVGISAAYVGLKIGEEIFNLDLPFYMEMGVATAVGSSVATNR